MKSFLKFPSIDARSARVISRYRNLDDNNNFFLGYVKLHGTNAAVGYDVTTGEIWYQSRQRVLDKDSDNKGFCQTMSACEEEIKESIVKMIPHLWVENPTFIVIFGEWAGPTIQGRVAISEIGSKNFFPFALAVSASPILDSTSAEFATPLWLRDYRHLFIWNKRLLTPYISLATSSPTFIQDMNEITRAVEDECPVAKHFGVSGIGEGLVWKPSNEYGSNPDFWFKTKGDKHQNGTSIKVAKEPTEFFTPEQLLWLESMVQKRLQQAYDTMCELHGSCDIKRTGEVIKWITQDIIREENVPEDLQMNKIGVIVSKAFREFLNSPELNP